MLAHLAKPGVVDVAIDEQVAAHHHADGKQRYIGGPALHVLGEVGQRPELEARSADWLEIKTNADRVARTDHLALDAELVTQSEIKPARQYDQSCGDSFPVGQCQSWRAPLVDIAFALAVMTSTPGGICARMVLTRSL